MQSKLNFRMVVIITVVSLVVLLAALFIVVSYEEARHHAIGNFAPIGQPTNFRPTTSY
jgi:hypothetical protein